MWNLLCMRVSTTWQLWLLDCVHLSLRMYGVILVTFVWVCCVNVSMIDYLWLVQLYMLCGRGLQHSICALPNPCSCKWNKICLNQEFSYTLKTFFLRKKFSKIASLRYLSANDLLTDLSKWSLMTSCIRKGHMVPRTASYPFQWPLIKHTATEKSDSSLLTTTSNLPTRVYKGL